MAVREVKFRYVKDASGRDTETVCVHLFVLDGTGPIETPKQGKMGGVRGRIACNPKQNTVVTRERDGVSYPCSHTLEVEAATCPDCLATKEAVDALERCRQLASDPQTARLAEIAQAQAAALAREAAELAAKKK